MMDSFPFDKRKGASSERGGKEGGISLGAVSFRVKLENVSVKISGFIETDAPGFFWLIRRVNRAAPCNLRATRYRTRQSAGRVGG